MTDKTWSHAKEYVLDPLTAPEPSEETGPGSHFRPPVETSGTVTPPPKEPTAAAREVGVSAYPSPPYSTSDQTWPNSSHRQALSEGNRRHRRGSSLSQRYPGDTSHRPLDTLVKEKHAADKARHITKKHHIQPDPIDRLDFTGAGGQYHHEGPYDATLFARNNSYNSAPITATIDTNMEALKATPHGKVMDSVRGHRPLDGVATYPPGTVDPMGQEYKYQEGDNMMIAANPEGGPYKRWPGIEYHPDDIKGKGEPSYSIEKALKDYKSGDEKTNDFVEMAPQSRHNAFSRSEWDEGSGIQRSSSLSKRLSNGLKKRIGSIKKHSRSVSGASD